MRIREIMEFPTIVKEIKDGSIGVHESSLRAFNILLKVKYLLDKNVANDVVLELIYEMENKYD